METADLVFRTLCFRILFYLGPSLSGSCACTSTRHRPCRLLSVVRSSTVQNGPLEITTFRARKFNSVLSRAVGGIASRREESLRTYYVCYIYVICVTYIMINIDNARRWMGSVPLYDTSGKTRTYRDVFVIIIYYIFFTSFSTTKTFRVCYRIMYSIVR